LFFLVLLPERFWATLLIHFIPELKRKSKIAALTWQLAAILFIGNYSRVNFSGMIISFQQNITGVCM